MQRTTALFAVLIAALAAAPAHAASRFVIRGAGFGHGVGMSQYGADGYAQHGKDYRFILAHYYTGTDIGQAPAGRVIRVLLRTAGRVSFTGADRAGSRHLNPATTYHVVTSGLSGLALRSPSGRKIDTFAPPLRVTGPGPLQLLGAAANGLSDGRYRGALEFRPTAVDTVEAINAVGLENYVRGVVGAESPPSWPAAALQAQAIAARTYAITTGGGDAGFDQFADTRSQMYRGVAAETPSTEAAVSSTAGQVVTYNGQPVVTYFFSTSGGRTEDVENSFIGSTPKPWLRSVSDPYDSVSPRHRWGPIRMTMAQAAKRLHGLVKGSFRRIDVTRRGESPRIVYADVVGTGGRTRVTGPTLRARLGLYDTWATFTVISSSGKPVTTKPPSGSDAPPSDEQTGGVPPGGGSSASGGSDPSGGARAAAFAIAGSIAGRVSPVRVGARIELELRGGGHWTAVAWSRVERGGRYLFADLRHGAYRVVWRRDSGPIVRL
jgi:stage II sporulation protein D